MRGIETEATLFWYLLSNQQNRREALLDQAGARHWRFRCGVRMVTGAFDDVDLYRFAAGFNRTAELIDADRAHFGNDWLSSTSNSILVLGCRRRGDGVEVDLYNTRQRLCHTTLNGTLVRNATLTRTDMLGFNPKRVKDRAIALAPLEFAKITVKSR